MQYLYSQNPSKQLCFALFHFCQFFLAHRIVSCFGNSICNSPKDNLGPVHMIPVQLTALGQLTDHGVNFASVHSLTPITVHMSFSLPRGNFKRRVTRCCIPPCRGNFSPCEQNAKVASGQE